MTDVKITTQRVIIIDDSQIGQPPEYEVFVEWRPHCREVDKGLHIYWSPIVRGKGRNATTVGYSATVPKNQLPDILANLFETTLELEFDGVEFAPARMILSNCPGEIVSEVFEADVQYEQRQIKKREEEERRKKEEAERLKKEEEERRKREEEEKRREQERKIRLKKMEMPVPEEVLFLTADAPPWLVEKVYKILIKEYHPDRYQKFQNGIHRKMDDLFKDVQLAYTLIKQQYEDWDVSVPLQIAERNFEK